MMETLPAGTILHGRYRVERALGSGGFGHVYLAIDLQTNQPYAVKEYLVTGASGKAQLEHEARVLSQLHHPSLPAFQDAFDERGRYYIVLSYIEGNDLTDCIRAARQKNEPISIERILRWILSICEAVTFLHSQHPPVIHRDIKPDNIRITPAGVAILVDLGNAKAAADGARTLFFIRHQGTPGYAPLEQYPGGSGTDTRSDVYALGGTLYFALTAHEPPSVSSRNSSISQGTPDLPALKDVVEQNPPESTLNAQGEKQFRLGISRPAKPAPRHSRHVAQLGTLPPDLLNSLNFIIHHAMEMKPQNRYQSVADMSNDLRKALLTLTSIPQAPISKQGRPIDPHSTQPDLPFLFESLQQGQASNPSQAAQHTTPAQPAPSIQPATQRCPRCQTELPQSATFCPRCGNSLRGNLPTNSQGATPVQSQNKASQPKNPPQALLASDIAEERTLHYTPLQAQYRAAGRATPPLPGAVPSTPAERTLPAAARPGSSSAQQTASPISPAPTAPRPFLQTVSPSALQQGKPESRAVPSQFPAAGSPAIQQQVYPAHQASQANPVHYSGQVHQTSQATDSQKVLFLLILAFIVILIVVVILLFAHRGGHAAIAPMAAGAYFYSTQLKGLNDERNLSLRAAPAAAHRHAGVR
jgi:serine/threonine protein kinase